ncbi:DUF2513 domain-containing protein [Bradyrhizobium sp. AUGA SZCCT0222]|uniref:DUF2513 domain-containing protein n=1 Tax=Bradyrhizobium sp. AUGA SZCCT0222 TaxID=2807668 RepID=UPI001BA46349|nr:DUF2513 domain-containing protein [Bradyrhizobium sp. AUGA SZCCT0222]MBR1270457.1 DUF2513 domain-containing protein [Bradyrhizobium sp. AUGA SZCCT0222]
MTRNMDTIRTLLLRLEALPIPTGAPFVLIDGNSEGVKVLADEDPRDLTYHLGLLKDKGLITSPGTNNMDSRIRFSGLSWDGYDFLDSVRDDKIWLKTKGAVERAGGFTLDLIIDLAKGFLKKQIENQTGIKL